jgi:DNA-binding MarR family transcriptional regulator
MAGKSVKELSGSTNGKHPFGNPDNVSGFLMWQLGMLWQRKLKNKLDTLGITHAQFLLMASLDFISTKKSIVSQQDIAKHCRIDKMMTSKILRILQKKGLLVRKKNKMDSRAKTLALSEEGQEILAKAFKISESVDIDFLAPLGLNSMTFSEDMKTLLIANLR